MNAHLLIYFPNLYTVGFIIVINSFSSCQHVFLGTWTLHSKSWIGKAETCQRYSIKFTLQFVEVYYLPASVLFIDQAFVSWIMPRMAFAGLPVNKENFSLRGLPPPRTIHFEAGLIREVSSSRLASFENYSLRGWPHSRTVYILVTW